MTIEFNVKLVNTQEKDVNNKQTNQQKTAQMYEIQGKKETTRRDVEHSI